jgi:hypothetical protein
MAVVHISEAEAALDFHAVLDRVKAGDDLRIESGNDLFALALLPA